MQLKPVSLAFLTLFGKPTVRLAVVGTDYSITYREVTESGKGALRTEFTPPKFNEGEDENLTDDDIPDEIDMLMAQGELLMPEIVHHLQCETHRELMRVAMSMSHTRMEKAKVLLPSMTELMIQNMLVALSNDMPRQAAALLNLGAPHVTTPASDFEIELHAKKLKNPGVPPAMPEEALAAIVLNFEPVSPALTDADEKLHATAVADLQSKNATLH